MPYVTPYVGVWIETVSTYVVLCVLRSHPTWVCGLKQTSNPPLPLLRVVTPYVGVWIETCPRSLSPVRWIVTPYVGVWIETPSPMAVMCWRVSHPTWVCGLKRAYYQYITLNHSHTLRGCVDWNNDEVNTCIDNQSHPTWVCGLKQRDWQEKMWGMVTPYVGVWIETSSTMLCTQGIGCHTLRGCVDWNINGPVFGNIEDGHTLRGNIWIGALFTRRSSLWKNCKHSASYVFLSRLLILLWLEKTRTSPNAYLLSVFFCCFT